MEWTRRDLVAAAAALPVLGTRLAGPALAAGRPRRIVSINSCTDGMLMDLADPSQIVALSHYARQPENVNLYDRAKPYPITYETAEEIIALRPDLVLASRHNALPTRQALKRLHIPMHTFGPPLTVDESYEQVRTVAALIGHPERGEALVRRIKAAFAAAAPPPGARKPSALIFQANGFTAGTSTLPSELLVRTGFTNAAGSYGLKRWGNLRLEQLLADPPDILLGGEVTVGAPTWADRVGRHPALASVSNRMQRDTVPEGLLLCGASVFIPAVQRLAAVRDRYLGKAA